MNFSYGEKQIKGWGRLHAMVSDLGVCQLSFDLKKIIDRDKISKKDELLGHRAECLNLLFDECVAFFRGDLQEFTVPVDLSSETQFTQQVLNASAQIVYGQFLSYGELAKKINNPKASRAVGQAMGRNPVPFVVP